MAAKSKEDEYRDRRPHFELMAQRLHGLVAELLKQDGLRVHAIESRAKSVESFTAKISRPSKTFLNPIEEVTDIVGVRVLLYYSDDIDLATNLLRREFAVHEISEWHEATLTYVNRFGYASTHCVLSLSSPRNALAEWRSYAGQKFEVQVRTVLQHAWAAISHSLEYKRETDVPPLLRRRLSRVAGLFELADAELISIRDAHQQLRIAEESELHRGNVNIPITVDAVREFIEAWQGGQKLMSAAVESGFDDDMQAAVNEHDYVSEVVSKAEAVGIHSIGELQRIGETDAEPFLKALLKNYDTEWYVSPQFLLMLQVIRAGVGTITAESLEKEKWSPSVARRVIDAAAKYPIAIRKDNPS